MKCDAYKAFMEAQSVVKRKYPGNSAWGCCFLKISQNNDLIVGQN